MNRTIPAMLAAAFVILAALPANAGPAPGSVPAAGLASGSDLLVRVHGCHFDTGPGMEPDPVNGYHYHDRNCRVVRLGPPPRARRYDDPPPRRRYRDSQPSRAPFCREQCRYVGPIKLCRTVCN